VALDRVAEPDLEVGTRAVLRVGPAVPRWVQVAGALVLAVNVVVLVLGTSAVGVSWDEPTHVERLRTYQSTGWYLPAWQMDGEAPDDEVRGTGVYAPVAALLGHAVSVLLGSEGSGEVAATAEAYAHRHLSVALLGILGLGATALAVRLLVGSWRWGLLAAAALSALPAWTGHAMFNIKDVPVATGYTLVTCSALAMASSRIIASLRGQILAATTLTMGAVLAVGTRPGMVVGVAASVAAALAFGAWDDPHYALRGGLQRRLAACVTGLAGAYVVLLVVYPALFSRPDLLVRAVGDSGEYPWNGAILTAGELMTTPPPPSYLPLWFLAQTPLVVLVLALVGLSAPVWLLARRTSRADGVDRGLGIGLGLAALQALLLPGVAVLTSAVLYDATRQVLFVQPALAIAATVAFWLLLRGVSGGQRWTVALSIVFVAGLVVPTVTHARLFPYSYTWFNGVAALRPIDGNWMTEYWRVSARELVHHIPAGGRAACYPREAPRQITSCEALPQFAPYWGSRGVASSTSELAPDQYYLARVNRFGTTVPEGCTAVHEVTRPLFGQDVLMSAVSRCTIPVLPYPPGGITSDDGTGVGYFVAGWVDPAADPVRSYPVPATIGFELPGPLRGEDLTMRIPVRPAEQAPAGVTAAVTVNGVAVAEVELAGDPTGPVAVNVPAAATAALDGRVYVELTLRAPDGNGGSRAVASSVSGLTVRAAR
jgi:hypothetical protein